MSMSDAAAPANGSNPKAKVPAWFVYGFWLAVLAVLGVIFREACQGLYDNYARPSSYYSHGFLVPFVSGYFVWRDRKYLAALPRIPTRWGYAVLIAAGLMVLGGDFLGVRIFEQIAIMLMLAGLVLVFLGFHHLRRMWFPFAFLVFMIPLPESLTTSVTFRVKLLASEGAVRLSQAVYLPMIRDGSYIHFNGDRLLIGDVCGGLRSLIALLALGSIMSYISQTRTWSRIFILLVSVPIAVLSNTLRIFFLCVVAYFWGSARAAGFVHDASGVLIYLVALALMLALEELLRRLAPPGDRDAEGVRE